MWSIGRSPLGRGLHGTHTTAVRACYVQGRVQAVAFRIRRHGRTCQRIVGHGKQCQRCQLSDLGRNGACTEIMKTHTHASLPSGVELRLDAVCPTRELIAVHGKSRQCGQASDLGRDGACTEHDTRRVAVSSPQGARLHSCTAPSDRRACCGA